LTSLPSPSSPRLRAALSFPGSVLHGLSRQGLLLIVTLAARVHRSAGAPGIDPGSIWEEAVALHFLAGEAHGDLASLPAPLVSGVLDGGSERYEDLVPLPLDRPGLVTLTLIADSGQTVVVTGSAVAVGDSARNG
jgi:hypothetical protein